MVLEKYDQQKVNQKIGSILLKILKKDTILLKVR